MTPETLPYYLMGLFVLAVFGGIFFIIGRVLWKTRPSVLKRARLDRAMQRAREEGLAKRKAVEEKRSSK